MVCTPLAQGYAGLINALDPVHYVSRAASLQAPSSPARFETPICDEEGVSVNLPRTIGECAAALLKGGVGGSAVRQFVLSAFGVRF